MILAAAVDLLLEGGANEVTATRIAERTGVARTTVYRQWPDQPALLLATIDELVTPHSPSPPTGDLATDLRTSLEELRMRLNLRQVRSVFAALIDHANRDDAFVSAQQRFVNALIEPTANALEHARERGDLPADADCSTLTATLVSPVLYQFLMAWKPVEDQLLDEVLSQFLNSHRAT